MNTTSQKRNYSLVLLALLGVGLLLSIGMPSTERFVFNEDGASLPRTIRCETVIPKNSSDRSCGDYSIVRNDAFACVATEGGWEGGKLRGFRFKPYQAQVVKQLGKIQTARSRLRTRIARLKLKKARAKNRKSKRSCEATFGAAQSYLPGFEEIDEDTSANPGITPEEAPEETPNPEDETFSLNLERTTFRVDLNFQAEDVTTVDRYDDLVVAVGGIEGLGLYRLSGTNLTLLSRINVGDAVSAATVVDNLLYMLTQEGEMMLIDISVPTTPVLLGGFDFESSGLSVSVFEEYVSVGGIGSGLHVFERLENNLYRKIDVYFPNESIRDLAMKRNSGRVVVFALIDLLGIGAVEVAGDGARGELDDVEIVNGFAQRMTLRGDDLYVAAGDEGVVRYDVDNPNDIDRRQRENTDGFCLDVSVRDDGDRVYIADGVDGVRKYERDLDSNGRFRTFGLTLSLAAPVDGDDEVVVVADRVRGLFAFRIDD